MPELSRIYDWYQTDAGQLIAANIEQHVWHMTACVFGYVAVQIGNVFEQQELLKNCTIRQKVLAGQQSSSDIVMRADAFSFPNDSLDLCVLPHTLDFSQDPHQVLREVERTLVPEGHMLIIGFNPFSFYGLSRLFLKTKNKGPWQANFYGMHRIQDWSALLGFDILDIRYAAHLPPFKKIQHWNKMQSLDRLFRNRLSRMGGVYIVLARKRVATITPLKRTWPSPNRILTGKLIKPTVGMRENGRAG